MIDIMVCRVVSMYCDSTKGSKIDPRRTPKEEPDRGSSYGRGVKGARENLQPRAVTHFLLRSKGSCLGDQAVLKVTTGWEAGLPVARTTGKPWPALPVLEGAMVESILRESPIPITFRLTEWR